MHFSISKLFNDTFVTKLFGRYCGHLQKEIIKSMQRDNVVSCIITP